MDRSSALEALGHLIYGAQLQCLDTCYRGQARSLVPKAFIGTCPELLPVSWSAPGHSAVGHASLSIAGRLGHCFAGMGLQGSDRCIDSPTSTVRGNMVSQRRDEDDLLCHCRDKMER